MSVDTITRFEDKANTDLVVGEGYYIVYASLNEDLPEQASAPFINMSVETFSDNLHGIKTGEKQYFEEGVVVFNVYDEKGSGTRDIYTYRDTIRDNFRDAYLYAGVGEEGTIYCYQISQRPPVEVEREDGGRDFIRLDVLVSYKKYYDV